MRRSLMICLAFLSLTAGCSPKPEPVHPPIDQALFCDLMTQRFRYRQEEIDKRAAEFPANLRREFQLNLHFDRECANEKGAS